MSTNIPNRARGFFSYLIFKPLNSFVSFFTGLFKPKPFEQKPTPKPIELKTISMVRHLPKNPTLTEEVIHLRAEFEDLKRRLSFFESEHALRARERAKRAESKSDLSSVASAPKEERSFAARLFSR